jgi:hypothetical protein
VPRTGPSETSSDQARSYSKVSSKNSSGSVVLNVPVERRAVFSATSSLPFPPF